MVDSNHPFFRDPKALKEQMDSVHERLVALLREDHASGVFSSTREKMEGHVVLREGMVGVWADLDRAADKVTRVVLYRVKEGEALVEEKVDLGWSYWDVVERARDWFHS